MAVMLCVSQVMDFLLVVVRLRLIMSGDVELNPGPLDQGGWSTKSAYMYPFKVSNLKCKCMYNPSATFFFSSRSILVKMQTIHVALKFVLSAFLKITKNDA